MRQVKLRTMLFSGFVFLILLTITIAFLGWHHLKALQAKGERRDALNTMMRKALEARGQEKNYLLRGEQQYVESMAGSLQAIKDLAAQERSAMLDQAGQRSLDQILESLKQYEVAFRRYASLHRQTEKQAEGHLARANQDMISAGRALLREIENALSAQKAAMQSQVAVALNRMGVSAVIAIILGILVSVFLVRSLTGTLNRIISSLGDGSEQVASASLQVSSASHSLAEGSSRQAASLEQTTASLEELAATVKQNSLNAEECNQLVLQTHEKTREVHKSIRATKEFMETISNSGESIKKIIKNIDEIAFQTNLLALNASVEAARAGQAGAGFAVVADEVRALAMRAAEAAKTTDDLIGETARQIELGSAQIQETLTKFYDMGESAKKVNSLVGEIAGASKEQAQGIEHLNQAMLEIDRVVQQNAASAEESASAAAQLQAQSESMREIVGNLDSMVRGGPGQYPQKTSAPKEGQHRQLRASPAEGEFEF